MFGIPSAFPPFCSPSILEAWHYTPNMSSPSKGRRRSSLSAAFDHFRNKCRRTRIDSLLSPPKLDSGTSNDEEEDFSPSDPEGVPLAIGSSDQSPGPTEKIDEFKREEEAKEEDKDSRCDSRLPKFIFDDDGFGDLELGVGESTSPSPDEDERLLSALADFSAEATEPEDFGRYFSLARQRNTGKGPQEEQISPTESVSTGVANASVSAGSMTRLLHSDCSGSTLDFEVGVPLHRTAAKGNLRQEWTTQVQTEPQTQEQTLMQSTYASLDEVVKDTVLMKEDESQEESERAKDVPVMRTVDGVRLDAKPLIRHSGTSAPPHSSLQLHEEATAMLKTAPAPQGQSLHRPQLTSAFSSSSESSGDPIQLDQRRRSTIKPYHPLPSPGVSTQRHQTTIDTRPRLPSYPPHPPSITSAPKDNIPGPKAISYSHTPPLLSAASKLTSGPSKTKSYTALSSPSSIWSFHNRLTAKLNTAISNGDVKATQIGVKERVRRLSGAKGLQQGWEAGAKRMSGWGKEIGEAVVASGGVGVGWGDRGGDGDEVGRRSAGIYYGGGFV
jgi:hypothetical protein